MPETNLTALFQKNERIASLASHLIAAVMLACAVVSFVQLGEFLQPGWQGDYLVIVSFLLAVESMYSYRQLHGMSLFDRERLLYRAAEWVIILLGLRLLLYVQTDFQQLWADLPRLRENFVPVVFTGEFMLAAILALCVWLLAASIADKLRQLEGDERLLKLEQDVGFMVERAAVRAGLANLILVVGGIMVFLAALIRLDLEALTGKEFPATGSVVNLLIFFILGLVLLSLTQFSLLRARWSLQRVPVSTNLSGHWVLYSLAFLLILSVVALLLPTGYSVGLLEALAFVFTLLANLLSLLIFLLLTPFMLLISLLASLFGTATAFEPPPMLEMIEPPPVGQAATLPEMIKSILFWSVFLAVIGFSLVYFLRQNKALSDRVRRFPLFAALGQAWSWLRRWFGGVNRAVASAVEASRRRLQMRRAGREAAPWDFINLRRLSPRQRVVFYYLAMLRRGSERGIPRRPGETPFEYAQELERRLPEVDEDVELLTRQFVEARFSRHDVDDEQSTLVQQLWQRIRSALRRLQA